MINSDLSRPNKTCTQLHCLREAQKMDSRVLTIPMYRQTCHVVILCHAGFVKLSTFKDP